MRVMLSIATLPTATVVITRGPGLIALVADPRLSQDQCIAAAAAMLTAEEHAFLWEYMHGPDDPATVTGRWSRTRLEDVTLSARHEPLRCPPLTMAQAG